MTHSIHHAARFASFVLVALLAGCQTSPDRLADSGRETDCPDPSVMIAIDPGDGFVEQPGLAEQLGAYRIYQAFGDHGTRVIVTFFPKGASDIGSIDERVAAHAERTNRLVVESVPGKSVAVRDAVPNNPFNAERFAWRAFEYPTGAGGTTICDAAALMGATPGGVWTISWNAGVGAIDDADDDIAAFLAGFRIRSAASP